MCGILTKICKKFVNALKAAETYTHTHTHTHTHTSKPLLSQKQIGTICFAFIFSIFSISAFAANNCTGATYYDADSDTCIACPTGYDYNTDAGKTSASQCQIQCAAGTYVPGYKVLEYLEADGNSYIDTGYIPNQNTEIVAKTMATTTGKYIYGVTSSGNTRSLTAYISSNGYWRFKNSYVSVSNSTVYTLNTPHDSVQNSSGVWIDGTKIGTYSSITNYTAPYTLILFGANDSSISKSSGVRIYSFEIKENNETIMNLIPVKDSNGVYGMYDTVTGTFFTNDGTGTFVAGPDVGGFGCVDVGAGYYAGASTTNYGSFGTRTACPAGTYSDNPNATSVNDCISCTGATYNDETAQSACKSCPMGYDYNTTSGKTDITECQIQCQGGTYVKESFPIEYTRLEYIESTGTQYINTGYVLDENDVVEVDYTLTNLSATGDKMIIAQRTSSNGGMWVETYGSSNTWYVRFGSSGSVSTAFQNSQTSGTFVVKKGSFSINGTKILSLSYSGMSPNPMTIFGRLDSSGNLQYPAYIQIGGVRIKNNGTMVHNYVPARRNSDGEIGMYDTVTGQFYTNAGTGALVAGPDVAVGGCADVGAGYWSAASVTNYGSVGTRTACPAGTSATNGTSAASCTECTGATYSTGGTGCIACPTGYDYNTTSGKTSVNQCQIQCVAGTYVPGYKVLEYLEADGNSYIDTGYRPNQNTEIIAKILVTTTGRYIYGVKSSGNSTSLTAYVSSQGYWRFKNRYVSVSNSSVYMLNTPHDSVQNSSGVWIDDTQIGTYSDITSFTAPYTLVLFGANGSTINKAAGVRIYSLRINENSETVMNLVPVHRNSDDVLGLYDTISGKFFTNAGTGDFIAGPENTDTGLTCVNIGAGYWSAASVTNYGSVGTRNVCNNKPNHSSYSAPSATSSCPWACDAGYVENNNQCEFSECVGATYYDAVTDSCVNCPGEYDYNTTSGKTAVVQCQIQCPVGTFVANANDASCTDAGVGYWATESIVNYGSTSARTACPAGTFTVGYGHGADEANDCGRILHLGDSVIYTRKNKPTTPALNIRMDNGDMYYIGLSTTDHEVSRLHFESGGTQWTAFDDSLFYGERDYDTGEQITQ